MTKTSPERREQRKFKLQRRMALLCGFGPADELDTDYDEYNRDLVLRIRDQQVGSGMRWRAGYSNPRPVRLHEEG